MKSIFKTLFFASDHAGFKVKKELLEKKPGFDFLLTKDLGVFDETPCDYPDQVQKLVSQIKTPESAGILICGSGQGMAMAANKLPHIRAALCENEQCVKQAREHNNANVLCLGARVLTSNLCFKLIQIFISTPFQEGRHARRVLKMEKIKNE